MRPTPMTVACRPCGGLPTAARPPTGSADRAARVLAQPQVRARHRQLLARPRLDRAVAAALDLVLGLHDVLAVVSSPPDMSRPHPGRALTSGRDRLERVGAEGGEQRLAEQGVLG